MLLLPLFAPANTLAQVPATGEQAAKSLFEQQRWQELVRLGQAAPYWSADLAYYYGMALARLERWSEATEVFARAAKGHPQDKRFSLELAGLAFRQNRYAEAKRHLRRALQLDPNDAYANDFFATLFFLNANTEAALKYWNRAGKPRIENVSSDPPPRLDPALLDRAFAFSPASILELDQFRLTHKQLELLRVFPRDRFELAPRDDGSYDVIFRAFERNSLGNSNFERLINVARNLPFQTVNLDIYNLNRSATNLVSMFRWDANKRRLFSSFSQPLAGDPKRRLNLYADLRKENWRMPGLQTGSDAYGAALLVEKMAGGAELNSIVNDRVSWATGLEVSDRRFSSAAPVGSFAGVLQDGPLLKYSASLETGVVRIPERRLTSRAEAALQFGKQWSTSPASFGRLMGSAETHWFAAERGDDYALAVRLRAARAFGQVPFDELSVLGVERDNDLWLRGHPGTRDGKKGSAPMGRDYVLLNAEFDKTVYNGGFFRISAGPFLDTGRIYDSLPALGSREWLCDIGVQAKLRLFGIGVGFSFGQDLRAGGRAWYASGLR